MSDDNQSGTEYLSESFGRLLGRLQEKDVLSDEDIEFITDGAMPDDD